MKNNLGYAISSLRHLYQLLLKGEIGVQEEAAKYLLGPAIEILEKEIDPIVAAYILEEAINKPIGYVPCWKEGPNYQYPDIVGHCRKHKDHGGECSFV